MSLQAFPSRLSTFLFPYVLYFHLLLPLLYHLVCLKITYILDAIAEVYCLLLVKARGAKGPIFEDGPNFDTAFRVFHGRDGVVPLSEGSFPQIEKPLPSPILSSTPWRPKQQPSAYRHLEAFSALATSQISAIRKISTKRTPTTSPR